MLDLLKHIAGIAFFVYVVYNIHWQLTIGAKRRRMIRDKGCLPMKKLRTKDPIFGLDMFNQTRNSLKQHQLLNNQLLRFKTGNTVTFPSLGRKIILTTEPENLKTIQALDFKKWSLPKTRKIAFIPFLGVGIFTSDGADWQHSRDMLRPNFHRSQVADLDTFEVHIQHLIGAIPTDGSTVDLQELFFRLTIDSATGFLFGESTMCLAPGTNTVSNSRFAEKFNRAQTDVGTLARLGMFRMFASQKQFKDDVKYVHEWIDYYVDKGLAKRQSLISEKANESARYTFIDELIRQTDDRVRIRSELLNILIAGRDTTASLLSNVWWTLSRRPDIWAKLREDVDLLGGEPPTWEQLKELKYLKAILNEALRLYPVVPVNNRQAVEDTTLPLGGGPDGSAPIFIPKGQNVSWSVYAMHRRKDYFGEDAEEFKPERWLGEKGLRPGWEYLPFNGGPRICIGQQFALTEASYTTIRLVQTFKDIESRNPAPWRESLTLTCVGDNCDVALHPF